MTGLLFAQAPPVPDTFNVLLYGPPKSGKSTAAATAPGPILWVSAEGPGALAYARKIAAQRGTEINEVRVDPRGNTQDLLAEVVAHVRERREPVVMTVVVDTVAKVREALIAQLVVPNARNSLQQYREVAKTIREFVRDLRDLPVNLVLIAHQDVQDADGERMVQPLVGGALTAELPGEVDVVAYTHSYKDEESGERKYVGQLVEARGRIAGDRSGGLGAFRELDLGDWLGAYRTALLPDYSDVPFAPESEPEPESPAPPPDEDPFTAGTVDPARPFPRTPLGVMAAYQAHGKPKDLLLRLLKEAGRDRVGELTEGECDFVIAGLGG